MCWSAQFVKLLRFKAYDDKEAKDSLNSQGRRSNSAEDLKKPEKEENKPVTQSRIGTINKNTNSQNTISTYNNTIIIILL